MTEIKLNPWRDYVRKTDHINGSVTCDDFTINIYPDTAKTLLGQKRQILKVARIIAKVLENPKLLARHSKPYEIWAKGWHKRMVRYHANGPSADYISYVNRARRKNRPNYITDSVLQVKVEWNHDWRRASEKTWPMANLIAEKLNRYAKSKG